jgi:hypothetical protein
MQARPPLVTPEIGQLIPKLSSETNRPIPSDPDQARFRLFDGIATPQEGEKTGGLYL